MKRFLASIVLWVLFIAWLGFVQWLCLTLQSGSSPLNTQEMSSIPIELVGRTTAPDSVACSTCHDQDSYSESQPMSVMEHRYQSDSFSRSEEVEPSHYTSVVEPIRDSETETVSQSGNMDSTVIYSTPTYTISASLRQTDSLEHSSILEDSAKSSSPSEADTSLQKDASHVPLDHKDRSPSNKDSPSQTNASDAAEDKFSTFEEWSAKIRAEQQKSKQELEELSMNKAAGSQMKATKILRNNYASGECGAKILATNPEAENAHYILSDNRDEYMINPCHANNWFVVELCEPVQIKSLELASFELFSSQPHKFTVYLSEWYPPKEWRVLASFEASEERRVQSFDIQDDIFVKYVKVEMVDHFGEEHYCPVSLFRVYGVTLADDDDDDVSPEVTQELKGSSRAAVVVATAVPKGEPSNLFESAKDTVLSLVKKVLKVEKSNVSSDNVTDAVSEDKFMVTKLQDHEQPPMSETFREPRWSLRYVIIKCFSCIRHVSKPGKSSATCTYVHLLLARRINNGCLNTKCEHSRSKLIQMPVVRSSPSMYSSSEPVAAYETAAGDNSPSYREAEISSVRQSLITQLSPVADSTESATSTVTEHSNKVTQRTISARARKRYICTSPPPLWHLESSLGTCAFSSKSHVLLPHDSDPHTTPVIATLSPPTADSPSADPEIITGTQIVESVIPDIPEKTDTNAPSVDTHSGLPAGATPIISTDTLLPVKSDLLVDSNAEKSIGISPSTTIVRANNPTKAVEESAPGMVRVPLNSVTKRETQIMRLSNRIKALEVNVSLSSRFLEELSQRYRRKSEDLAKLLNSTSTKLLSAAQATTMKEQEVTDTLQIMEDRIDNISGSLSLLTQRLDSLTMEMRYCQLTWAVIEITMVVIVLAFCIYRRQPLENKTTTSLANSSPVQRSERVISRGHQRHLSADDVITLGPTNLDVCPPVATSAKFDEDVMQFAAISPSQMLPNDGMKTMTKDNPKKKKKRKQPNKTQYSSHSDLRNVHFNSLEQQTDYTQDFDLNTNSAGLLFASSPHKVKVEGIKKPLSKKPPLDSRSVLKKTKSCGGHIEHESTSVIGSSRNKKLDFDSTRRKSASALTQGKTGQSVVKCKTNQSTLAQCKSGHSVLNSYHRDKFQTVISA